MDKLADAAGSRAEGVSEKRNALISTELRIDGFEHLRAATPATKSEIIQLEAGRMQGHLKHATIAGLALGFGTFSRGLLSRGVFSDKLVTIGFLFDHNDGPCLHKIETLRIWSPGAEHQQRYPSGITSFGGISVSAEELAEFLDNRSIELPAYGQGGSFHVDDEVGLYAGRTLRSIMTGFDKCAAGLTQGEGVYWKRAILEAITSAAHVAEPPDMLISSPKRLVRKAQEYIDRSGSRPLHISELLSALHVSRRTLHRSFDEVLGIPPMTYLWHKRLCAARILLKERCGQNVTVADVAFRQGFSDFGRFSGYYRQLFGENPSETLRSGRSIAS